jgi:hypothetical protein
VTSAAAVDVTVTAMAELRAKISNYFDEMQILGQKKRFSSVFS